MYFCDEVPAFAGMTAFLLSFVRYDFRLLVSLLLGAMFRTFRASSFAPIIYMNRLPFIFLELVKKACVNNAGKAEQKIVGVLPT